MLPYLMNRLPPNEFSCDTEYQPSMDKWYHIIQTNMRDGETFGECELRLRSYVATGEPVKYNWQGKEDEYRPI
jgi:hypothetical protein